MTSRAGKIRELGIITEIEFLQSGAGGDLIRQSTEVVGCQR